ncbi:MAG TPA: hypothetical protein VFG63_07445 [Nocardioidaceae bacterium]|nr:hypothetical protein [Nocardioidaceae bacterium]
MSGQSIATWIQAVGSAGSLLAFAAWVGIAVINHKTDKEMRFERDAQTVAAWVDKGSAHDCDDDYVVCITNGGDAPVYECKVTLQGLVARNRDGQVRLHLVPPRSTKVEPTPSELADLTWEDVYESGVAPEIAFRDSSGRHWRRDGTGVLTEQ